MKISDLKYGKHLVYINGKWYPIFDGCVENVGLSNVFSIKTIPLSYFDETTMEFKPEYTQFFHMKGIKKVAEYDYAHREEFATQDMTFRDKELNIVWKTPITYTKDIDNPNRFLIYLLRDRLNTLTKLLTSAYVPEREEVKKELNFTWTLYSQFILGEYFNEHDTNEAEM